mgnify:CR=1 FL=1
MTNTATDAGLTDAEATAFRQRCVDFFESRPTQQAAPTFEESQAFHRAAAEAGVGVGIAVPTEYGGAGLTLAHDKIWRQVKEDYPVMETDSTGLWAGIDDLIFAGGGALVGIASQGVVDGANYPYLLGFVARPGCLRRRCRRLTPRGTVC